MRRLITLQLIVAFLACSLPISGRSPGPGVEQGVGYIVLGESRAEFEVIAEVSSEFREVDLELPGQLIVHFTAKPRDCGEYSGIYVYGKAKVTLCRPHAQDWKGLHKLVRHELGHAWDDHNMTDGMRSHYMSKIGKTGKWLDMERPHDDRPGERFANTVAGLLQGLIDRERFDQLIGAR